jgi:hypothetical protein
VEEAVRQRQLARKTGRWRCLTDTPCWLSQVEETHLDAGQFLQNAQRLFGGHKRPPANRCVVSCTGEPWGFQGCWLAGSRDWRSQCGLLQPSQPAATCRALKLVHKVSRASSSPQVGSGGGVSEMWLVSLSAQRQKTSRVCSLGRAVTKDSRWG